MPSLKDLKNRIGSVKSTQKITSAMKMVAAAKLRKAQEQALASRPYTSLMDSVVSKISSKAIGSSIDLLSGKEEIKTHLLVVFSADRGLCGGFNGSITRTVRSEIKKLKDDGINVKLLMVGKKSADALNREFGDLFVEKIDGNSAKPNYTDAEVLAKKIIDYFLETIKQSKIFPGRILLRWPSPLEVRHRRRSPPTFSHKSPAKAQRMGLPSGRGCEASVHRLVDGSVFAGEPRRS